MSDDPIKVALIIASIRDGRFGPSVANWLTREMSKRDDLDVDVIDLAESDVPSKLTATSPPQVTALTPRLDRADAFVVVTCEYNHSFPASLKAMIDWHMKQWQAKPVGFASYGGMAGGLRAVEQLRLVFAELHAVTIRDTVSFHNPWERFEPEMSAEAAKVMLDQLVWWAKALRDAKARRPYGA